MNLPTKEENYALHNAIIGLQKRFPELNTVVIMTKAIEYFTLTTDEISYDSTALFSRSEYEVKTLSEILKKHERVEASNKHNKKA